MSNNQGNDWYNTFLENIAKINEGLRALETRPSGSHTVGGRGDQRRDDPPRNEREIHNPNPNPNLNPHLAKPLFDKNISPRRERHGRNNAFANMQGRGKGRWQQEEYYFSEDDDDFQEDDH